MALHDPLMDTIPPLPRLGDVTRPAAPALVTNAGLQTAGLAGSCLLQVHVVGMRRLASSWSAAWAVLLIVLNMNGTAAANDSSSATPASTPAAADEATFVEATIRLAGPSVGTFNASQPSMLIRREHAVKHLLPQLSATSRLLSPLGCNGSGCQDPCCRFVQTQGRPLHGSNVTMAGAAVVQMRVKCEPAPDPTRCVSQLFQECEPKVKLSMSYCRALASVVTTVSAKDITMEAVHGVFSSWRRLLQDTGVANVDVPMASCMLNA